MELQPLDFGADLAIVAILGSKPVAGRYMKNFLSLILPLKYINLDKTKIAGPLPSWRSQVGADPDRSS